MQYWQQAFVNQKPLYLGDLDFDEVIALSDLALWQAHFTAPSWTQRTAGQAD